MITPDQAQEAAETLRWCKELQASEAFKLFLAELAIRRDQAIDLGRDLNIPPDRRTPYHVMSHEYDNLLGLVDLKIEGATERLKQWAKENQP